MLNIIVLIILVIGLVLFVLDNFTTFGGADFTSAGSFILTIAIVASMLINFIGACIIDDCRTIISNEKQKIKQYQMRIDEIMPILDVELARCPEHDIAIYKRYSPRDINSYINSYIDSKISFRDSQAIVSRVNQIRNLCLKEKKAHTKIRDNQRSLVSAKRMLLYNDF